MEEVHAEMESEHSDNLPEEEFPIVDDKNTDKDGIPQECLQELGKSNELKTLLCNRHLQDLLLEVERSDNKASVVEKLMQIPLFVEFADQCLAIVFPDEMEKENKTTTT